MSNIVVKRNIGGIEGLCLIRPKVFKGEQGYVFESYNELEFHKNNLNQKFVQDNQVYSKSGVLRGMHVNVAHPQGKLIYVIKGHIFDVVVDLRKDSKTYKKSISVELSDENKAMLYIPEGMGHGYYALTNATIQIKVTTHYIPDDEVGFSWNSKFLDIQWPFEDIKLIQNDKDANNIDFDDLEFKG